MRGFWLRSSLYYDPPPREGEKNQPHKRNKHLAHRVLSLSWLPHIVGEAVTSQGFCKKGERGFFRGNKGVVRLFLGNRGKSL